MTCREPGRGDRALGFHRDRVSFLVVLDAARPPPPPLLSLRSPSRKDSYVALAAFSFPGIWMWLPTQEMAVWRFFRCLSCRILFSISGEPSASLSASDLAAPEFDDMSVSPSSSSFSKDQTRRRREEWSWCLLCLSAPGSGSMVKPLAMDRVWV